MEHYIDEEEESLLTAIKNKNEDAVKRIEKQSKNGKIIRVI